MGIDSPRKSAAELAEIIGIMMGDGGIYLDPRGKYQITISFHKEEGQYRQYVKALFENFFSPYRFCVSELKDEFMVRNNSVKVGAYLISAGLQHGDKTRNNINVPSWIHEGKELQIAFTRGLFDTDGCVYRKYAHYAQIQFKLASEGPIRQMQTMLFELGFTPTKVQKDCFKGRDSWKFYLVRQHEIDEFFLMIRPANEKHISRYNWIRKNGGVGIRTQIRRSLHQSDRPVV